MVAQPLDVLGEAVGIQPLDRFDNAGMELTPPLLEEPAIDDLVG